MNNEQRQILRESNRANNKAYHHGRKWYNISHLAAPLEGLRKQLRRNGK